MSGDNKTRDAYDRYRSGDGITDEQLDLLLEAIEAALPFLSASPAFSLVHREALTDREALQGFKQARSLRQSIRVSKQ
jgi:hypothetical protein